MVADRPVATKAAVERFGHRCRRSGTASRGPADQATRSENVSWISQSKLAGTLPFGSAYSRRK